MAILSYYTTKPIILLFEIIFMILGRIYGTNVVIILDFIIVNILLAPLFFAADARLDTPIAPQKEKEFIVSSSYMSLFLFIHIAVYSATFSFISGVDILSGATLGPINDLSLPDSLLKISSFSINILPFIFLFFSILSVFIHKTKTVFHRVISVVLYIILCVLLYFSPAGTNLFWIFYAIIRLIVELLRLFIHKVPSRTNINCHPTYFGNLQNTTRAKSKSDYSFPSNSKKKEKTNRKPDLFLFLTGITYLIILTGIFIPTNIMKVSAAEFVDVLNVRNPLHYILYSCSYAVGVFGIWLGMYYYLANKTVKILLDFLVWIISVIAFINLILAGSYLGETSTALYYFEFREFDFIHVLIDVILSVVSGILIIILIEKKKNFIKILVAVELGMVIFSSFTNCIKINNVYRELDYLNSDNSSDNIITLSKNGKNIVVLIMDRALSTEVPYIFNDNPNLQTQFDGFTFYPNTVSFGGYTNTAIPSVYGGYEYTPDRINARADETLQDKQDEALKVIPVLFAQNGYNVTVCDPAYAGYNWIPNLTIYDEYDNINAFNTDGRFDDSAPKDYVGPRELLKRNFFVHSLMKISPFNWQFLLYNESHYCNPNNYTTLYNGSIYQSEGYRSEFLDAYLVLINLSNITKIEEKKQNNLLIFYNGTPHMPCLLQEPDYIPTRIVDNSKYHQNDTERFSLNGSILPMETSSQLNHYCVNMTTYIQLGKWFDYLRKNGCYDNTRIILVSDHGRDVHLPDKIKDSNVEMEYFLPVLMVKDFNAIGFNTSNEFMTNADVAALTCNDVINKPANPFSGNLLDGHEKNVNGMTIFYSDKCNLEDNHGNIFVPGQWFLVHDNPREIDNWSYLGDY